MITVKQEEKIRILLKAGLSGHEISRLVGVSTCAVYAIRKMIETIAKLTPKQRNRIKMLLDTGMPAGAIEMQMCIPRTSINAVRRYYYIHPERFITNKPNKCPACGAVKISGGSCTVKQLEDSDIHQSVNYRNAITMYRIIEDIIMLGDSGIIVNPSFYNLVAKAKAIAGEINEENQTAKPHENEAPG